MSAVTPPSNVDKRLTSRVQPVAMHKLEIQIFLQVGINSPNTISRPRFLDSSGCLPCGVFQLLLCPLSILSVSSSSQPADLGILPSRRHLLQREWENSVTRTLASTPGALLLPSKESHSLTWFHPTKRYQVPTWARRTNRE